MWHRAGPMQSGNGPVSSRSAPLFDKARPRPDVRMTLAFAAACRDLGRVMVGGRRTVARQAHDTPGAG